MAAPIRFLSGRQQQQKIGIEGSTENQKVLEVVGQVGIGTTIFSTSVELEVHGDIDVDGHTELDNLNVSGVSTFVGVGTFKNDLYVNENVYISGFVTATRLYSSVFGEFTGSSVSADNIVGLALSIAGLSTFTGAADFNGDIDVDGHTELDDVNVSGAITIGQDLTVNRDVQINRNLNVNGNITIGGTSATLFTETLKISDPDIVLGFRTDANGNDVSNDTTASHGGVAIASTEGSPLVNLVGAGETLPTTYKKIMWFKEGSFTGLGTDAWLINYGVGIGSTQFPTGTRLAAGSVQFTENDLAVIRNINASGVVTASNGFDGNLTGIASTASNLARSVIAGNGLTGGGELNADRTLTVGVGTGITINSDNVELRNSGNLTGGTITKWDDGNGQLTDSLVTETGTIVNVGSGITFYTSTGIISATAYFGSGGDLEDIIKSKLEGITARFKPHDSSITTLGSLLGTVEVDIIDNSTVGLITAVGFGSTAQYYFNDVTAVGLTTDANVNTTGIITAGGFTASGGVFTGDGSGLTNLGGVSAGVTVTNNDATVGTAAVLNFGENIDVSPISAGVVTFSLNNNQNFTGIVTISSFEVSGVSTFAGAIDANGDLDVDGHTELDNLNVSGVSTFTGAIDANGGLDVTGHTELDSVNVSGISTFTGAIDANGGLDVTGHTELDNVNVAGVSTLTNVEIGGSLYDSNNSTGSAGQLLSSVGSGISWTNTTTTASGQNILPVSGSNTYYVTASEVTSGVSTSGNINTNFVISGVGSIGIGTDNPSQKLQVNGAIFMAGDGSIGGDNSTGIEIGAGGVVGVGTAHHRIRTSGGRGQNLTFEAQTADVYTPGGDILFKTGGTNNRLRITSDGNIGIGLNNPTSKLHVNGTTKTENLIVSGVSTFTGSADFNGNLDVDGQTELDNVNVSGVLTATSLNVTDKLISTGIGISVLNGASDTATIAGPSNLIIDPGVVGDNTGIVRIKGDLFVDGTQTTVNSTTVEIADKVIGIATTCTSDLLTDGAGIGIGTDKTFLYEHNSGTNPSLKSSENLNVPTGKGYQVNQVEVLNATTLGSSVVNSSLTSVGTLSALNISGGSGLVANTAKISDLTDNRVVIAGNSGELEDSSKLTFNGTKLAVDGNLDVTGFSTLTNVKIIGALYDSSNSAGNAGVVLSSTGAGISWTNSTATASGQSILEASASTLYYISASPITSGISTAAFIESDIVIKDNNIGIGTTNPQAKLHVVDEFIVSTAGAASTQRISEKAYTTDNGTLSWEGSSGQLFSISNNLTSGSIFSVNDVSGIPSIDVDADGTIQLAPFGVTEKVGIGTTNPQAKLDVVGDSILSNVNITGIATFQNDVKIGTGATTAFFDISTGRIGIGTDNPTQKLDVNGNIRLRSALYDNANQIGNTNEVLISTGSGVSWATLSSGGIAGGQEILSVSGSDTYYITASNVTSGVATAAFIDNQVIINGNGNIGIGSTQPLVALDVAGNIKQEIHTPTMPVGLNDDIGVNWTKIEMGADLEYIYSLVYCGNGIVLAGSGSGTGDGDIYRSTDFGLTFTKIEMGADLEFIFALVYCGNGIVLAGSGTGTGDGDVYRSTDFGLTFTKIEMGADLEYILSLVYCGNGIVLAGSGAGTGDGDVYRSTDFGLTFTKIEMGADLEFILALVYCGNGIVLAGSGTNTGEGDVYRSTDFGLTFTKIEMGAGLEQITKALEYCGNGIVLAGSGDSAGDGDIYRSTDFGLTYTKIEMGSGLERIGSLVYCGNGIVLAGGGAGTGDGDVYRSTDFGLTFTKIEMGAGLERINSLLYLGNGIVLAGSGDSAGDGDIYRSDVGFSQASTIQGIYHEHLTGNIGIGTTVPTTALHVIGEVTATDYNSTSDAKLKTNVQVIEDPLEKVLQIDGVSFNWIENNKPSMGVIADNIQEVLPELVSDSDPKTVNYNGLIGLLIECVKQQQVEIEELKRKIR